MKGYMWPIAFALQAAAMTVFCLAGEPPSGFCIIAFWVVVGLFTFTTAPTGQGGGRE